MTAGGPGVGGPPERTSAVAVAGREDETRLRRRTPLQVLDLKATSRSRTNDREDGEEPEPEGGGHLGHLDDRDRHEQVDVEEGERRFGFQQGVMVASRAQLGRPA